MSNNFFQNETLKSVLVSGYRAYAMSLVNRSGPRIFVNSIPKAGTHLFTSILDEMPGIMNSGLHIPSRYINTMTDRNERVGSFRLDVEKFDRKAKTIRPGQYFSSHIFWDEHAKAYLANSGLKLFFVTRDPRDMLVSSYHYIMGLRRHYLHDYVEGLGDPIERFKFLLLGKESDPFKLPQRKVLEGFLPWMQQPFVCHVKFEDLVGERGGGSEEVREATLQRIFEMLEKDPGEELERNRKMVQLNPTLRRGKIGSWQDELPPEIQEIAKGEIGHIVSGLGYA